MKVKSSKGIGIHECQSFISTKYKALNMRKLEKKSMFIDVFKEEKQSCPQYHWHQAACKRNKLIFVHNSIILPVLMHVELLGAKANKPKKITVSLRKQPSSEIFQNQYGSKSCYNLKRARRLSRMKLLLKLHSQFAALTEQTNLGLQSLSEAETASRDVGFASKSFHYSHELALIKKNSLQVVKAEIAMSRQHFTTVENEKKRRRSNDLSSGFTLAAFRSFIFDLGYSSYWHYDFSLLRSRLSRKAIKLSLSSY
ncbi:hypothetical protein EDC96DRAFT_564293 [Choanephora cucurbitarum]|nr:hypothetical protein EDC96DRAFT_564293 [Choanephora cucurbitarum]